MADEKKKKNKYRDFDLNGIDVHFRSRVIEISIKFEYVGVVDVSSRWYFLQNFLLRTSQTLQYPPQFFII